MAKKKNTFTPRLEEMLDGLTELNHLSFVQDRNTTSALRQQKKRLEEPIPEGKRLLFGQRFGMASRLSVADLPNEKPSFFPHTSSQEHGEQRLLALVEELNRRMQGQILSSAYELAERFLKDTAAVLLYQARTEGAKTRINMPFHKSDFHQAQRKWREEKFRKEEGTPAYFTAYTNWRASRNCSDLIADICKAVPEFEKLARQNWQDIDLIEAYATIEFCRHALVHAGGAYAPQALSGFTKEWRRCIESMTVQSVVAKREVILPETRFTKASIEWLAAFAFALYVKVSELCDMKMDYPPWAAE
jgi:hypothetical protein